ncbi:hypothetical protein PHMEG_00029597 [Phytophthora megakarya]|uniref:Uncharacterized protein n=1 Tax=Phytophthora megakarya TaxID=4795 RepID=A0A225V4R3_9STRA|nr:hypothetical protein PHMEG_00029597 [Phytophthora megakarya]
MEGELAEWGYIVQYEDGSEGRRKTTMSPKKIVAYLLYDRTGDHSLLLLGVDLHNSTMSTSGLKRSNSDSGILRTINSNLGWKRFKDSQMRTVTKVQKLTLRKTRSLAGNVNKTHLTGQSNRTLTMLDGV